MKYSKVENIASKRGYKVTEDGLFLNPKGCEIGTIDKRGYKQTNIRVNFELIKLSAHRLQAFQKYGNKIYQQQIEVRHKNGIRSDNTWENILIGSHKDNMMDIPEQIRVQKSKQATSFVSKHNKLDIIEFYNKVRSYKKTMDKFNISSKGTLNYILKNNQQREAKAEHGIGVMM